MKFRIFFSSRNYLDVGTYTTWPGDVYALLIGAGSFVALMVAGIS